VVPESPCQRAQGWLAVAGAAPARTLQASLSLPPTLQGQGQIQRRLRPATAWEVLKTISACPIAHRKGCSDYWSMQWYLQPATAAQGKALLA
jgi:hypothetical protein